MEHIQSFCPVQTIKIYPRDILYTTQEFIFNFNSFIYLYITNGYNVKIPLDYIAPSNVLSVLICYEGEHLDNCI